MDYNLSGQRAIVVGAAQGIGRRCAHALADVGAIVTVADINGDLAAATAAEICAAGNVARAATVDIVDPAQCAKLVAGTAESGSGTRRACQLCHPVPRSTRPHARPERVGTGGSCRHQQRLLLVPGVRSSRQGVWRHRSNCAPQQCLGHPPHVRQGSLRSRQSGAGGDDEGACLRVGARRHLCQRCRSQPRRYRDHQSAGGKWCPATRPDRAAHPARAHSRSRRDRRRCSVFGIGSGSVHHRPDPGRRRRLYGKRRLGRVLRHDHRCRCRFDLGTGPRAPDRSDDAGRRDHRDDSSGGSVGL